MDDEAGRPPGQPAQGKEEGHAADAAQGDDQDGDATMMTTTVVVAASWWRWLLLQRPATGVGHGMEGQAAVSAGLDTRHRAGGYHHDGSAEA